MKVEEECSMPNKVLHATASPRVSFRRWASQNHVRECE